ncbi:hypothetical protein TRFO_04790 [Tritrichomonas foetus]|uniref:Uncharacterized protein n=1 Tax=Tritrichomonas foetus TaxID=1144522 RepID=A0A1J4KBB9_9EUKA|nr:hypothetical protein TRFO_04790 [Tritrichomonas foetus]|eukprot:OHT08711.1 hypothetical protein TRFO_04790 [Tritrichomonas foetus]
MLWLLPIVTLSFTKRKLTEVISDSYTKYFVCIGNPKELPSKCDQIANATYSTWNEAVANTKSLDEYMIFYIFYKDADVTSTVSFNGKNQFLAFDTIADNNGKFAKIYGNLEITKVDQQVYIFGEENVDGFSGDLNLRLHCSGMNITTISEDIPGVPLFLSSPIKSLHIDYAYA